jgi:Fibronectin type III domain
MRMGSHWRVWAQILGTLAISATLAGCGSSADGDASASDAGNSSVASTSSSSGATSTDTVTLSWAAPTENTNGSALTNLAGYVIYYGTSANALTQKISVDNVGVQTYVVSNLSPGNWYFQIVAVNSAGVESSPTGTVSASI